MTGADDTVVIAVGIDFEESDDLLATSGLAQRALDFAQIARNRGVPKESIFLMVGGGPAVDAEAADVAVAVFRPLPAEFHKLVAAARDQSGCDAVVVYWTGHGAVGHERDRCLLFADAADTGNCVSIATSWNSYSAMAVREPPLFNS